MEFFNPRKKKNFLAFHQHPSNMYMITLEKTPGTRDFVSERLYLNRGKKFIKNKNSNI